MISKSTMVGLRGKRPDAGNEVEQMTSEFLCGNLVLTGGSRKPAQTGAQIQRAEAGSELKIQATGSFPEQEPTTGRTGLEHTAGLMGNEGQVGSGDATLRGKPANGMTRFRKGGIVDIWFEENYHNINILPDQYFSIKVAIDKSLALTYLYEVNVDCTM